MNAFFSWFFRKNRHEAVPLAVWLKEAETKVSTLRLRRGQRLLARICFRKMREIHTRFSKFYSPYAKRALWEEPLQSFRVNPSAPENLLLATKWLLKKHAAIAAEFRALETSLARVSFDEIAPGNIIEVGFLLDQYVEQTAFRFSEETLANTLNDWQENRNASLSLAETEALSPLLRLLALDKLSAVTIKIIDVEEARAKAERFFKKFGPDQIRYEKILKQLEKKESVHYRDAFSEAFNKSFAKEVQPRSRFRETGGESTESLMSEQEKSREKGTKELAARVRILLRSLSLLGEFEWTTLLKKTNTLHKLLIRDPADIYATMTTLSQEVYRKKAASVAKVLRIPEETLARTALALSEKSASSPENHIGFYLLDDGLPLLLKRLTGSSHLPWWHWYHDREKLPIIRKIYFGCILFSLAIFSLPLLFFPIDTTWFLPLLTLPLLYKGARHLVDSFFVGIIPATFLPRINFRNTLPESASALFVIPAFLKNTETLRTLMGKLETAALSNTKGAISFCLLLDYPDADRETLPEDEAILREARDAFQELNARYGCHDRFFFFLRSRIYSSRQKRWMGWERKRGKLLDFARALRGRKTSSPFFISSKNIPAANFIITIDEDAFVPRDFVKSMLGIHAHPLQKPLLTNTGTLSRGYTFIQPNVKQWFKNRHQFRLPRIFFDEKRFSVYSNISPEIYQDLFLEGSYAGKGSFHVDGFLAALDGTLPTDQVLSHDLLEGSFGRTAYAADVDIFDEFPKSLRAMLARSNRWTRGDWQIIDWLFAQFRNERGEIRRNPLLFLHRFKIVDNLLQSLLRPTVFLMTILSWILGNTPLLLFSWTIFLLDIFFLDVFIDWTRWSGQLLFGQWKHLGFRFRKNFVRSLRLLRQSAFECIILPYAALDTLFAIGTALFRRYGSGKNMLEWVPSTHFENPTEREPILFPLSILALISASVWFEHHLHPFFIVLLSLWMIIPLLVFILNRPYRHTNELPKKEKESLRRDALETWSFFSDTVLPETNFLPPDYVRFEPAPTTAQYTSITNIGFFLTSVIVAHRLGFISLRNAQTRLEQTIQTIIRLEKYRGHPSNWYHLETALPAPPSFISSVDSGNLLAALIVTRQWLSLEKGALDRARSSQGLRDMTSLIKKRIPSTLEWQSFADFWEAISDRVDAFASERNTESAETFVEWCVAIETSLSGIALPKSLPSDIRNILDIFRTRIRDVISEHENNFVSPNKTTKKLEELLDSLITDMRFDFLKSDKHLLISLGFHIPTKRLENRFYQTLASEARITNLIALAEGTLSFRGWNKLNRTVLSLPGGPTLISWTGTLFEYLMPAIFLEEHADSLVGRSIKTALRMNQRFALQKNLPVWGLSESGYAELDRGGSYRYKPFGLPSLSLSPTADNRAVISAYSSALALSSAPRSVLKNLASYGIHGGRGMYGYIEAIDFHRSRHGSPIKMFMSHHQGMILASIGNMLFHRMLSRLFESHPLIQNSLFVLDESLPPIDKVPFPHPSPVYLQHTLIHPRTP